MELCVPLKDKVHSGLKAFERLRTFMETYRNRSDEECFQYFLLCSATSHNPTELVKHLLTDTRCNRKISLKFITSCLFVAIREGNTILVTIFLNSSSSFKLLKSCFLNESKIAEGHEAHDAHFTRINETRSKDLLSMIECACLYDQRDILKLLVTYHVNQKRRFMRMRSHRRIEHHRSLQGILRYQSDSKNNACSTPLHVVINLLRMECFRKMLTLPAITQIMLDAGVDVNALDFKSSTALDLLIDQVNDLISIESDVTAEECQMITDTAHILLAAGSFTSNHGRYKPTALCTLTKLIRITFRKSLAKGCEYFVKDSYFKMVSELILLLIKHGALSTRVAKRTFLDSIMQDTTDRDTMYYLENILSVAWACKGCMERIDNVIIGMSDIINYVLILDADIICDSFSDASVNYCHILNAAIRHAITRRSRYSSEQEHSNKIERLMLSGLTAAQVIEFKMSLIESTGRIPPSQTMAIEYTRKALEYVNAVELPFSLQHLSRHAITRAMSYRCLGAEKVATLGLPKRLREYILQ